MRRILISVLIAAFTNFSIKYREPFGSSGTYEKPKDKKRTERRKGWRQNLQAINHRQKGLRSPIGRGK